MVKKTQGYRRRFGDRSKVNYHQHSTISTAPSAQHHQHSTISTAPSTQHHQHNTVVVVLEPKLDQLN
jgi:hypothetical protein